MNIPLNINLQQILLHLFNFTILIGGLYFLLYKPVKDFMDKRTLYYQNMDQAARKKIEEAEALNHQYEEHLNHIDAEIRQKRLESFQSVKEMSDRRLAEADNQARAIVAEAEKTAERTREKVLQETQKELQDLALSATRKIVLQSGEDAFDQFLKAAERGTSNEPSKQ